MPEAIMSIWPLRRAGIRASKPRLLTSTCIPVFSPMALAKSISKPTYLPLSVNSKGGKVGSMPTTRVFCSLAAPACLSVEEPHPASKVAAAAAVTAITKYFLFIRNNSCSFFVNGNNKIQLPHNYTIKGDAFEGKLCESSTFCLTRHSWRSILNKLSGGSP